METEKKIEGQEITTALAKENVTEAVIARFKANYLPLKINGLADKEGYEKVKSARLECKNTRVLAEKICKKGREEAIKIQKDWIAKEKDITGQIRVVEDHLVKQEEWFDTETAKAKLIALRTQQLPSRKEELTKVSAKVPTDEILLGMDDMAFMTYLNNERTRILNEKEEALKAKEREQEVAKVNEEKGPDSLGVPYIPNGDEANSGMVFVAATPKFGVLASKPIPQNDLQPASDKQILLSVAEQLYNLSFPLVKGDEANKILTEVKEALFSLSVKIVNVADTLK